MSNRINTFEDLVKMGNEPPSRKFTDEEKRIIAIALATNLAALQLAAEGVYPIDEVDHLGLHLTDFIGKLFNGPMDIGQGKTISINSALGERFLEKTMEALSNSNFMEQVRAKADMAPKLYREGDKLEEDADDTSSVRTLN